MHEIHRSPTETVHVDFDRMEITLSSAPWDGSNGPWETEVHALERTETGWRFFITPEQRDAKVATVHQQIEFFDCHPHNAPVVASLRDSLSMWQERVGWVDASEQGARVIQAAFERAAN